MDTAFYEGLITAEGGDGGVDTKVCSKKKKEKKKKGGHLNHLLRELRRNPTGMLK